MGPASNQSGGGISATSHDGDKQFRVNLPDGQVGSFHTNQFREEEIVIQHHSNNLFCVRSGCDVCADGDCEFEREHDGGRVFG